jgi:hypothetical protein
MWGNLPAFTPRAQWKPQTASTRIDGLRAEIWTWNLLNEKLYMNHLTEKFGGVAVEICIVYLQDLLIYSWTVN